MLSSSLILFMPQNHNQILMCRKHQPLTKRRMTFSVRSQSPYTQFSGCFLDVAFPAASAKSKDLVSTRKYPCSCN